MTGPFAFLQAEWPAVYEAADRAAANPDPRTARFFARRALELAVAWATSPTPRCACPTRTT